MSYLNANIPLQEAFVREEYLRNLDPNSRGKVHYAALFGVASIPGNVPLFHSFQEDGGIFWRLPISAFCWREDAPEMPLDELMLWDSFSYYVSVTEFDILHGYKMKYTSRRKNVYEGTYLFTLDWAHPESNIMDAGFSEDPGQHKCGHFIALDNGNFAIQPNNRLRMHRSDFCTKEEPICERLLHERRHSVENQWKWVTSDDDKYDYDIIERKEEGAPFDFEEDINMQGFPNAESREERDNRFPKTK